MPWCLRSVDPATAQGAPDMHAFCARSAKLTTFVFLIGNGRSGSSLVHELLARHPDVGFVSNVEDRIPLLPPGASRYNNQIYRMVPQALTRKGRVRYAPSEGYRVLARQVSPMVADSMRDLVASDAMPWVSELYRSFFLARARAQGKRVFLHKLTGWPRTGFIQAVFPDARFIHILRDGRAVVASALKVPFWYGWRGPEHIHAGPLTPEYAREWEASGRSFPLLAGLAWKTMMDAYARAKDLIPPEQWLDIRFEDLVADPVSQCDRMVDFMGLEPNERFEAALSKMTFVKARRNAYHKDLDARSIGLLDSSLKEHLLHWGYSDVM